MINLAKIEVEAENEIVKEISGIVTDITKSNYT